MHDADTCKSQDVLRAFDNVPKGATGILSLGNGHPISRRLHWLVIVFLAFHASI